MIRRAVGRLIRRAGFERLSLHTVGYSPTTQATIDAVMPFTMTSPGRISALCDAVAHVERYGIPGAIVECGVWRGGSAMAAARTLLELGSHDRDIYLFDTYEGMTEPTDVDRDVAGVSAADFLAAAGPDDPNLCIASLDDVQANMGSVGYPAERVHFVQGMVEDTIPAAAPDTIAVLRLDTDWYESTKHELEHLMDRVSDHGVLIIDDYGHWLGARKAVDEFLATYRRPVLLNRIDDDARIAMVGSPI